MRRTASWRDEKVGMEKRAREKRNKVKCACGVRFFRKLGWASLLMKFATELQSCAVPPLSYRVRDACPPRKIGGIACSRFRESANGSPPSREAAHTLGPHRHSKATTHMGKGARDWQQHSKCSTCIISRFVTLMGRCCLQLI
jgi:hypothetical protein